LREPTDIKVTRLADDGPTGYRLASALYRVEPDGLTFDLPVQVEMAFAGDAKGLQLFWSNDAGGFSPLDASASGQHMRGDVWHFSRGFTGQASQASGEASQRIGPAGGTLTLDELTLTIPQNAIAEEILDHGAAFHGTCTRWLHREHLGLRL
jgi:hypothetical protein